MTKDVTRNILELVGEHVGHVTEFFQCFKVIVGCDYMSVAFCKCRSIRRRVQCKNSGTLAVGFLCDHKTELPASDYAYFSCHLIMV